MTPVLATDWTDAIRVSLVGFTGVFVVLALLYASTSLYGALVRWIERSRSSGADT